MRLNTSENHKKNHIFVNFEFMKTLKTKVFSIIEFFVAFYNLNNFLQNFRSKRLGESGDGKSSAGVTRYFVF